MKISPFRALRPAPEKASEIISVPYDVVNTEEARALVEGKPDSFLRVLRSEVGFPPGTNPYGDEIYSSARANLDRLIDSGAMLREEQPTLYVYVLEEKGHRQMGLVARVHADDYVADRIKKHELTRPEKEKDRTRHVDTLGVNAGPVFLSYRDKEQPKIRSLMEQVVAGSPLYDITREDGVRHTIFAISDEATQAALIETFGALPALYIADGHHRAASAANVCAMRDEREGGGAVDAPHKWFLAVCFPDTQLKILPYNRAVRAPDGFDPQAFLKNIASHFTVSEGKGELHDHEMNLFMGGKWYHLKAAPETYQGFDETESLDVSVLARHILEPHLGIADQRTSDRIQFVGGIRGDKELERLVNEGKADLCFSMYATTMEQLLSVADAGKIMPPKSTWFEPKLCSGFLVNELE